MSLRTRLSLGVVGVVAAALVVLGVVVDRRTQADLTDSTIRSLQQSVDRRAARADTGEAAAGTVNATLRLAITPNGRVNAVQASGSEEAPDPIPEVPPDAIERMRSGQPVVLRAPRDDLRYLAVGAVHSDGRLLVEAAPTRSIDATTGAVRQQLVVGGSATLAVAVIALVLLLRRDVRPLGRLAAVADEIAAGGGRPDLPQPRGSSDVRRLTEAFSEMVSRQDHALGMAQEARARLEEFVADAAHELHTPVTSVVGWSDLLGSGDLNDESTATAIRRIGEEARRLADLVDDLATLAWMDVGPVAMVDRVALAPLINDAIADAVAADATRKIEARISAVPDVDGRSGDLRRVVDNLLRNVRSHTPAGTRVLVTLDLVSDGVVLEVADDGPGFPPSSVDRVFDRFWRADPSRTRASGGSGLGLAIVGSIVRAHGGEVAASRSRLGGAAVTVRLSPTGSSMSGGTVPPGDPSCDA